MLPAIRVENLSKSYRVGRSATPRGGYRTLRESLVDLARSSLRRTRGSAAHSSELFWALKGVDFEVQPGAVVGIIGRNGAGKSTLLKILSRITRPTAGRVELRGRVGSLLEVGTGFHPELTGRENIFLNGSILGMRRSEIARKFDEIVAFAEVERFLDTPVKRYSSGMYVRLAFAVAAHLESEILIIDEVLAVGDSQFQARCLGKMSEVASSGRTILFVTHNMTMIQQLCQEAVLVASGRIALSGPTSRVVARYLSDGLSSASGHFALDAHPTRTGSRPALILSLTVKLESGVPTSQFRPRDALVAEVVVAPETPIRAPRVALAIEDDLGRRIVTFASFFQDRPLGLLAGKCRIVCQIPCLNLAPGHYLLSVSIADPYAGLLDSLEGVARIEVVADDIYGNGEPHLAVYGPVIAPSSWELRAH